MKNLFLILALAFLFTACNKQSDVIPPEASFTTGIVSGSEPKERELVQFTNTSTGDNQYLWDFGDGSTSTDINPSYAYNVHGIYTVTLKVTDKKGQTSSFSQYVTILCKFKNNDHLASEEL